MSKSMVVAGLAFLGILPTSAAAQRSPAVATATVMASVEVVDPVTVQTAGAASAVSGSSDWAVSVEVGVAGRLPVVMAASHEPGPVQDRFLALEDGADEGGVDLSATGAPVSVQAVTLHVPSGRHRVSWRIAVAI